MCFSARASFAAAALLLPLGALAVEGVRRGHAGTSRLPLALTPLLFGLQQALEGLVWLGLGPGAPAIGNQLLPAASLAYLFFAYGLWPGWIGFVALRWSDAAAAPRQHHWLRAATVLGVIFGLSLWLPMLLDPAASIPTLLQGSLRYPVAGWIDDRPGRLIGHGLYALLVGLPLILPPADLRWFGLSVLLAFAFSQLAYAHVFVSMWCFFSAVLSLEIVWIVSRPVPLVRSD